MRESKMESTHLELKQLKDVLAEKNNQIDRLQRETHKLRSVLERSNLKRIPSIPPTSTNANPIMKKCGVSGESWEEPESPDATANHRHPKDFRTRQLLRTAIGDNTFLKNLDSEQIRHIVDFMFPQTYGSGEFIIREGEPGHHLFVSAQGQLEVLQENISLGLLGPGKAFGELALLYNCKRTASIKAVGECKVWALDRRVFHQVMVKAGMRRMEDRLSFLKSIPLLRGLEPLLLSRVADHLELVHFESGAVIIREGEVGDTFFIISGGSVEVRSWRPLDGKEEGETVVLRQLGRGDYFGEKALLKEERRSADVVAMGGGCDCLSLDRESFLALIGQLSTFHPQSKTVQPSEYESKSRIPSQQRSLLSLDFHAIHTNLSLDDLEVVTTLGVGGFGRVELVQTRSEPSLVFALKCLPKAEILATQQKEHVFSERSIMATCNSPFIIRLWKTFKDAKFLYFLMEACLGGEIWTLLRDRSFFDEETTRFVVGCVLLALDYLHTRDIVYRDLKPENLMVANNGYVKLVDFGFSKVVPSGQRTWTFCGTPEYVAPEIILNRGHDRAVDFWAVGVLLFELLSGLPPWGPMAANGNPLASADPLLTYNQILKGIEAVDFPKRIGRGSGSLIRRLCRQLPGERLGAQAGVSGVTSHRWFQGLDWDGLSACKLPSPISPSLKGPTDTSHFDKFSMEISDAPDDLTGWDVDF